MKKILLLGGSGILSSKICDIIVEENEVVIVNRGNHRELCNPKAKLIVADLKKDTKNEIEKKLENLVFDTVIDFISYTEEELKKNLSIFASKTSQYIFISSATIYKTQDVNHRYLESDSIDNREWKYCIDKRKCEELLKKQKEVNYTIIRPYVTYGKTRIPYQIMPLKYYTIIDRILKNKPIPICGMDTKCTITFVDDFAVGAVGLIGNAKAYGECFHITGVDETTWSEIIETVAVKLDRKVEFVDFSKKFLKEYEHRGLGVDEILGDKSRNMLFDNSKIKSAVPEFCGNIKFSDKVDEILEYYSNEGIKNIDYLWEGCLDWYIKKYSGIKPIKAKSISIQDKIKYSIGYHTVLYYSYKMLQKIVKMLRR